jgi:hypothetical protein
MVVCSRCKKEFTPLFDDDSTQAMHCSAEIVYSHNESLRLVGFYGSTIADGNMYEVLTSAYRPGIICDSCIETGLENFHFKLISTDNYL